MGSGTNILIIFQSTMKAHSNYEIQLLTEGKKWGEGGKIGT